MPACRQFLNLSAVIVASLVAASAWASPLDSYESRRFGACKHACNSRTGVVSLPDGSVIGTTYRGGKDGLGVVYSIGSDRKTLTVLHEFASEEGYRPGGLVLASDGMLYGVLAPEPGCGGGIFRMAIDGSRYEQLHTFRCDEGRPTIEAVPIEGPDGAIYATPQVNNGRRGCGTVVKMTKNGKVTVLHEFNGNSDGCLPNVGLAAASTGDLYGTTSFGGAFGQGTLYRISRSGDYELLRSFGIDDGETKAAYPHAPLTERGGMLYGMLNSGSAHGLGTVFKVDYDGQNYEEVHPFSAEGADSRTQLLLARDGSLYGTTLNGGTRSEGNLFSISPTDVFSKLHSFGVRKDGRKPWGALVQLPDGTLAGTTELGGGGVGYGSRAVYWYTPTP